MSVVDLRSDTVTKPSAAMRQAMANADVADDVYGEDPTVRRLQDLVADLIGTEAALFVPSGTMANQVALRSHTKPADEVIAGRDSHVWKYESGALAGISGVQTSMLRDYLFTGTDVRAAFKTPTNAYWAHSRVLAVENTHNDGGGVCWDPAALADVTQTAHDLGLITHLDGARLWNAAVAGATTEKALAKGFDSVSVCLSKGLGAPVGSLVCGSRDFITRCHRFRKMHGGGMRQAGIIAAGGLYAVENNRARLVEDHANALAMAERLVDGRNTRVDLASVQTNILMIDLERGTAQQVIDAAKAQGVLLGSAGTQRVRAVTHLDVDRDACLRAASVIADVAATL
ncbi:MAG TPA: GntG family PLP-dependent aldolase [Kofleriaceae bacterium]|jgi:threonine aldolase